MVIAADNRIELLVKTTEGSSALVAAPVDHSGMDAVMGDGIMGGNGNGNGNGNGPGSEKAIELLTLEVTGDW